MPDRSRIIHLLCGQTHARGPGSDDEEICRLASRQQGVVGRRQLLALGISDRAISHRLRAGRLRTRHPGVYAVGHDAISYAGHALAAVLALGTGSAASHMTAVALWNLGEPPARIHATATRPRTRRPGMTIYRRALAAGDVAFVDGVPTTTVPRTLLDLSATIGEGALRRLIKRAEFADLTTIEELRSILARHPRRAGRRRLARIIAGHVVDAGRTRSELEDRFLDFCSRHGLPAPEVNAVLEIRDEHVEVDCLWRAAGLVLELDGWEAHGGRSAFQADRARDRALIAAGFSPMRVTWAQLHRDGDSIESEIRDVLTARTPKLTKVDEH
jgi:Transcriptional regulator, AbiEi antitoxin